MQLETDRLIVRYWHEKDMGDLVEGLNNFNVSKWLAVVPFPYLEMHAMQWLQYCLKNNAENNKNSYEFCIELKATRKVIGGLSVSSISKLNGTSGVSTPFFVLGNNWHIKVVEYFPDILMGSYFSMIDVGAVHYSSSSNP